MYPRLHAHVVTTPVGRDARLTVRRGDEVLYASGIDDETLEDHGWEGHHQPAEGQADGLLLAALDVLDNRFIIPDDEHASVLEYDDDLEDGHPAIHIITNVEDYNDPS